MWQTENFSNESDVEQKFLFPFFVTPVPMGLGLPESIIQTKVNIRRFQIGKDIDQKLYFPDYLFVLYGFPLVVIEAKGPKESVEEGFRQARLYALELNSLWSAGFNPAKFILASNGKELWLGLFDQAEPIAKALISSLGVYSIDIAQIQNSISWPRLENYANQLAKEIRPENFYKPRRMVGGIGTQNEEVGKNTFGATLTATVSPIFNPTTKEEKSFIAKNGYIPSQRRERYVDPIDRVIRAAKPPSESEAILVEDSAKPVELINKLREPRNLEHKVLLIIGSVGSGKTTFIDHLHEVALPRELVNSTVWYRLNMNLAPVSPNEIYGWLRTSLVEACRNSLPNEDFDDLEILKKIYSVDINRFTKGVGKLYAKQPELFNVKLGEHIERAQQDAHSTAVSHIRYCCGDRNKLCIIVLDNCDKKSRDEQLLMFETAQWLQKEFRALVILPLRDETYDNHRDQPPLDTALKDLVFRIEPPLFQQVLVSRVQLALNSLKNTGSSKLHFSLPNGFKVEYERSDQAFYLASIIRSLFEHDRFVRRMIVGLSGRNMRNALEIFLQFCNSAHIGEDQIFKIRQSEGQHTIPLHQVATVLMRMNRRFYDSDNSFVKNIFSASKDDAKPSFFCRYMILRWLRHKFAGAGTNGLKGYYSKSFIKQQLITYGLSPDILDREFNYLLNGRCVIAEHLRTDSVEDDDLVRLGPAGFVHLDLVGNVSYLAAVSEDTFFTDRQQAERVTARIRGLDTHLHVNTAVDNARELVDYLSKISPDLVPPNGSFLVDDPLPDLIDISDAKDALLRVTRALSVDPWYDVEKRLTTGSVHEVLVVNCVDFGCFVEIDNGLQGLVHISNMNGFTVSAGDRANVEVIWVDAQRRKISLLLRDVTEEDVGDRIH